MVSTVTVLPQEVKVDGKKLVRVVDHELVPIEFVPELLAGSSRLHKVDNLAVKLAII